MPGWSIPPPRTIGAALRAVKEPGLERRSEEVEGVGARPAYALVGAADEVAGEQRIVEQRDVVANREEAASVPRLHRSKVLAAVEVEAVHHTCDKERCGDHDAADRGVVPARCGAPALDGAPLGLAQAVAGLGFGSTGVGDQGVLRFWLISYSGSGVMFPSPGRNLLYIRT